MASHVHNEKRVVVPRPFIVQRVVGGLTDEDQLTVQKIYQDIFIAQDVKYQLKMEGMPVELSAQEMEVKKTSVHYALLDAVMRAAKEMVEEYGFEWIPVTYDHFHVIPPQHREGILLPNTTGTYNRRLFAAFLLRSGINTKFALWAFHELCHLQSYQAFKCSWDGNNFTQTFHRFGIIVDSCKEHSQSFFLAVNEAVTAELTARFWRNALFVHPLCAEEIAATKAQIVEEMQRGIRFIVMGTEKIALSDVCYLDIKKNGGLRDIECFGYEKERMVLNRIIDRIYDAHRDLFAEREEVFTLFARAMFGGNLLPLARMIECTFGKGSFSALADGNDIT
jgi:hypothetical protein